MRHVDPFRSGANPAALALACDPRFLVPDHVTHMAKRIAAAIVHGKGRLIVAMPPRHGKSTMCTLWAPLWVLDNWPRRRVVVTAHTQTLADYFGRHTLGAAREYADQLTFDVSPSKASARDWETTAGGGVFALGIGGALPGRGADVLVIDDPIASAEAANSVVQRDKQWDWYTQVARNRMEPGGTIIVVMTRWNVDDMVGRIEESEGAAEWEKIVFPAVAEEHDVLGRAPGEPLWKERFDLAELDSLRRDSTDYGWQALYQQHPAPPGGALFQREHFRYYRRAGDGIVLVEDGHDRSYQLRECWIGQTVDTAMVENSDADYTVVLTFMVTPKRDVLIMDVARTRIEIPDQWDYVMAQRDKWRKGPAMWRWIGCENKASGIGLLQLAKRYGVPMRELEAERDKWTRATDAAVMYQRGSVWHPQAAPWLGPYERELLNFPYDKHDDQVDCVAYACRNIAERGGSRIPHVEPVPEYPEDLAERGGSGWGM